MPLVLPLLVVTVVNVVAIYDFAAATAFVVVAEKNRENSFA